MDSCPAAEKLHAYACGQLHEAEVPPFEQHLDRCERCCVALSQVVSTVRGINSSIAPELPLQPLPMQQVSLQPLSPPTLAPQSAGNSYHGALQFWSSRLPRLFASSTRLPRYVGRYRVQGLLGSGGFGSVLLATDEKLERQVAIKVPNARLAADSQELELILTEAKTVARLDHPNIVPIYDVGSSEEFPVYLVSKLVEGSHLAQRLWLKISQDQALRWASHVAEALAYAHSLGVVHRDIKPQNILIDKDGIARLVDFGLAWRVAETEIAFPGAGTPAYMSPEQASGCSDIDGRSDIYSLGAVLVEMLARSAGFSGVVALECMDKLRGCLDGDLLAICQRATAQRPSDRFQDAHELLDSLRAYAAQQHSNGSTLQSPLSHGTSTQITTTSAASSQAVTLAKTQASSSGTQRRTSGGRFSARSLRWAACLTIMVLSGASIALYLYQTSRRSVQDGQPASQIHRDLRLVAEYLAAPIDQLADKLEKLRTCGPAVRKSLVPACEMDDRQVSLRARLALVNERPEYAHGLAQEMIESEFALAHLLSRELALHRELLRELLMRGWNDAKLSSSSRLNISAFWAQAGSADPFWSDPARVDEVVHLLTNDLSTDRPTYIAAHQCVKRLLVKPIKQRITSVEQRNDPQLIRLYETWERLVWGDIREWIEYLVECPAELIVVGLPKLEGNRPALATLREIFTTEPSEAKLNCIAFQRRRVMAAYALSRLGSPGEFVSLWHRSAHPDLTTVATHVVADSVLTFIPIVDRLINSELLDTIEEVPLDVESQIHSPKLSERRQLVQAFSRRPRWNEIGKFQTDRIIDRLRVLAIHDADPGMQAQAYWVIKGITPASRWHKEEWFPRDEVRTSQSKRAWNANSLGMIMVDVRRADGLDHDYCISQREVERRLFAQFLQETRKSEVERPLAPDSYESVDHQPQCEVSWYDCAAFCNWLSCREGLDTCYDPNAMGNYASGMMLKADALKLNGYRLPTKDEWAVGCRAGAKTLFCSGDLERTMVSYGWTNRTTKNVVPTGHVLPNALGLFDMHGNASEWILDPIDGAPSERVITDSTNFSCRGGSVTATPRQSAWDSYQVQPAHLRRAELGFRIARTITP